MFKREMLLTSALLLPVVGFFLYQIVFLKQSDIQSYQQLVQRTAQENVKNSSPSNHHRKTVRKDIWFAQEEQTRLHYQILSDSSMLTLVPLKNRMEIIETLQGIKCWMQDKLYLTGNEKPMQQVRYMEAETGIYHFTTQEFNANEVELALFRLPGNELPKQIVDQKLAYLQGVAKDISFQFSGKTPQFFAKQFHAKVVKE